MVCMARPARPVQWPPAQSRPYKVNDMDDWNSVSSRHSMPLWALIDFNFKTRDTDEINWYLRHYVGCTRTGPGGHNFRFDDTDTPGVIYVPAEPPKRPIETDRAPLRLPPHPRAFKGIELDAVVEPEALPFGRALSKLALTSSCDLLGVKITYRLYPHVDFIGPHAHVLYYVAYNTRKKRAEWVIGPDDLKTFNTRLTAFVLIASKFYGLTGHISEYEKQSGRIVFHMTRGDKKKTLRAMWRAWKAAWTDPYNYVDLATSGLGKAPKPRPRPKVTAAAKPPAPPKVPPGAVAKGKPRRRTGGADTADPVTKKAASAPTPPPPPPTRGQARLLADRYNLLHVSVNRHPPRAIKTPERFRHTLTATDPRPSFAQIERHAKIDMAKAGKAHYGDGLYTWEYGTTGVAKYIDIEIGPGHAVERIDIVDTGHTYFRIVPDQGRQVTVRIVGTNLTAEEMAYGRMMAFD